MAVVNMPPPFFLLMKVKSISSLDECIDKTLCFSGIVGEKYLNSHADQFFHLVEIVYCIDSYSQSMLFGDSNDSSQYWSVAKEIDWQIDESGMEIWTIGMIEYAAEDKEYGIHCGMR